METDCAYPLDRERPDSIDDNPNSQESRTIPYRSLDRPREAVHTSSTTGFLIMMNHRSHATRLDHRDFMYSPIPSTIRPTSIGLLATRCGSPCPRPAYPRDKGEESGHPLTPPFAKSSSATTMSASRLSGASNRIVFSNLPEWLPNGRFQPCWCQMLCSTSHWLGCPVVGLQAEHRAASAYSPLSRRRAEGRYQGTGRSEAARDARAS